MRYTNNFNLPAPVFRALTHDEYDKGASNRSVTGLIDAPRRRILLNEHDDEITQDVSELVWSAHGKAMHKLFEGHGDETWLPEQRLFTEVEGWVISGQIDVQHLPDQTVNLWDYKECKAWAVMLGKDEWIAQQNLYALLVRRSKGLVVSGLNVLAIIRDWFWRDAKVKPDYPQAGILPISLPLWEPERAEEYLLERVKLHQEAEFLRLIGEPLPPCSPAEMWEKPTTYAVKKKGNKRALPGGIHDTPESAEQWAAEHKDSDKLVIEHRPGERTRCLEYCLAAPFCDQYQTYLKEQADVDDS